MSLEEGVPSQSEGYNLPENYELKYTVPYDLENYTDARPKDFIGSMAYLAFNGSPMLMDGGGWPAVLARFENQFSEQDVLTGIELAKIGKELASTQSSELPNEYDKFKNYFIELHEKRFANKDKRS